jgi:hypothetical protein
MDVTILKQAQEAGIELAPEDAATLQTAQRSSEQPQQQVQQQEQKPQELSETAKRLQELELQPTDSGSGETAERQEQKQEEPKDDDDLSWLDLSEDLGIEEPVKEAQDLPDTPEAQKFAEDFKQYLGFDISELRDGIQTFKAMQQEIVQYKTQKAVETSMKQLQNEWGVDSGEFDSRMTRILDRFNKYPAELKAKLDNVEGAKLLWAKIEQEERAKGKEVPRFERSSNPISQSIGRPMFTWNEINAMSNEEYVANADRITYAAANGLIK